MAITDNQHLVGSIDFRGRARSEATAYVPWMCAAKPLLAIVFGQLVEEGKLDWESEVAEWIPEFSAPGLRGLAISDLLTHRAGLSREVAPTHRSAADVISAITRGSLIPGFHPGRDSLYSPFSNWYLLGSVVQRLCEAPLTDVLATRVFNPLKMRMVAPTVGCERRDVVRMFDTRRPKMPRPIQWVEGEAVRRPDWAFAGVTTPIDELAAFYRATIALDADRASLIRGSTLSSILMPRVPRMRYHVGGELSSWSWGLGVTLGLHRRFPGLTRSAFGHFGYQGCFGLADPELRLVIACATNGLPGPMIEMRRAEQVVDAVIRQLCS